MSQEGRGCLVGDQGGSDKVAQFKMEGLRDRKENTGDKRQINRSRPKNKNPTFFEPRRE